MSRCILFYGGRRMEPSTFMHYRHLPLGRLQRRSRLSNLFNSWLLMNEIYVDDILSGGHTIEDAEDTAAGNADPELRANMPQMTVPKFSDACVDWPGYYYPFTNLMHNNNNLNNVQRLHFLKESLPISCDNNNRQMQLTDVNYAVAWGMMIKRYNNPRLVFSHHMNAIYALPRLQKGNTDSIWSMLNAECLLSFRRVQALEGESQHWLAHYVTSKLLPIL